MSVCLYLTADTHSPASLQVKYTWPKVSCDDGFDGAGMSASYLHGSSQSLPMGN